MGSITEDILTAQDEQDAKAYLELSDAYLKSLRAELSLHEFLVQGWHVLEPGTTFVDGWHIHAICEHLEAVSLGQIQNLIINVPPRSCKTMITGVMWPTWWWLWNPSIRFYCASHTHSISKRDTINSRLVMESEWYQRNWGSRYNIIKSTETKIQNSFNGYRQCTSTNSRVTGDGGDVLMGDDLNDTQSVLSDTQRNKTISWYSTAFSNRLNDQKTGRRVIIMQRSHEMDITGYITANDDEKEWVKLILPYEFDKSRHCKTIILPSTGGKIWQDPRTKEGELIWPQKEGPEELRKRKKNLGNPYNISGQLQQLPSPAEGYIIRRDWFRKWNTEYAPKNLIQTIQSWDTALEAKDTNCWSACTTWGLFKDDNGITNLILLGLWRGKVEYPELRRMAQRLYKDYRDDGEQEIKVDGNHSPDIVLIENKVSGHSLIQDLTRAGIFCIGFNPNVHGDKMMRVRLVTPYIESGLVWLPTKPPDFKQWRRMSDTLVNLCASFPNAEARDIVDTMVQAMLKVWSYREINHPSNPKPDKPYRGKPEPLYGVGSE